MNENEKIPSPEDAIRLLAESYGRMAHHAHDIAYARRTLYEAYLHEGFDREEALELCKIL